MADGALDRKEKGICGLISIGLFLFLLFAGFGAKEEEAGQYSIVCLGDSVLGQVQDETGIAGLLEQYLQVPVFNGAFGGSNLSRLVKDAHMAYDNDGLSGVALSQAIAYEDFGAQQTIRIKENGTEYFTSTVDELAGIDFEQVEVLLIEHGTNDYNSGIALDNEDNPYDIYTYGGALRTVLSTLQEAYPNLRIILMTPAYSWFPAWELTCETWYTGYGYLEDYVELEIQIAEEMDVEVIDNYHNLYPDYSAETCWAYTKDGLHPNEAGRQLIATAVADYLTKYPEKERM